MQGFDRPVIQRPAKLVVSAVVAAAILTAFGAAQARPISGPCAFKITGYPIWFVAVNPPPGECAIYGRLAGGNARRTSWVGGGGKIRCAWRARPQYNKGYRTILAIFGRRPYTAATCRFFAKSLTRPYWVRVA